MPPKINRNHAELLEQKNLRRKKAAERVRRYRANLREEVVALNRIEMALRKREKTRQARLFLIRKAEEDLERNIENRASREKKTEENHAIQQRNNIVCNEEEISASKNVATNIQRRENDKMETISQVRSLKLTVEALKSASLDLVKSCVKSAVDRIKGGKGVSKNGWKMRRRTYPLSFKHREKENNSSRAVFPVRFLSGSKLFVCIVCNEEFETEKGAGTHLVRHKGPELLEAQEKYETRAGTVNTCESEIRYLPISIYKCELCAEKCFQITTFRKHVIEKHKENKEIVTKFCFPCSLCDEIFILRCELMVHLRHFHEIFTQCPICDENIENQPSFSKHVKETHSDCRIIENLVESKNGFFCKMCGFCSRNRRNVSLHIKEAHRQKESLQCEFCKREFNAKSTLVRHRRDVHIEKLFCCEICGKKCSDEVLLKRHKRKQHSDIKKDAKTPVECKVCQKTFAGKFHYTVHFKAVHQGKRDFQCTICEKTFTNPAGLHQHKITVCEKDKALVKDCPICGKKFDNYLLLSNHKLNIHKFGNIEENICHICEKTYKYPSGLYAHNRKFHSNRNNRRLPCSVCGKSLANRNQLLEHWRSHREDKPYTCSGCYLSFKDNKQFLRHRKKEHPNELETVRVIVDSDLKLKVKEDFNQAHANYFSKVISTDATEETTKNNHGLAAIKENHSSVSDLTARQNDGCVTSTDPFKRNKEFLVPDSVNNKSFCENNNSEPKYTDFSRANVPVSETQVAQEKLPDNENVREEQILTPNVDSAETFDSNDDFSNFEPPSSPMEHYDENSILEDTKPYINESFGLSEDPFKKRLVVEIEKLKECLVCKQFFTTSNLFAHHMRSKGHRAAMRVNNRETIFNSNKKIKVKCKAEKERKSHKKNQANEIFPCVICNEKFSSFSKYKIHSLDHKKTVNCLLCPSSFPTVRRLVDHYISEHDGQKVVKCKICDMGFLEYQMKNLRDHLRYTHAPEKRKSVSTKNGESCDICGEKFMKRKLLRIHLLSHNDEKHNCVHCEKEFRGFCDLEDHYNEIHNGEMPYSCGNCSLKFSTQFRLQLHEKRIHSKDNLIRDTNDGKLVCDICGDKFNTESHLKHHKETHIPVEERSKFFCEFCGKSFLHQESLKRHVREHTGEKPFSCTICGDSVAFIARSYLNVHMESVHSETTHLCDICGKAFGRHKNLVEHRKIHSTDILHPCNQCTKTFPSIKKLNRHLKCHNRDKYETKIPKELPFPCQLCPERFNKADTLKRHLDQLHDPSRPFGCDQCSCRFNHKSNLNLHIKGVHEKQTA